MVWTAVASTNCFENVSEIEFAQSSCLERPYPNTHTDNPFGSWLRHVGNDGGGIV